VKQQSGTLRSLWRRLVDREKFPRSLWYPVTESLEYDREEEWHQDFSDVSATVRRSMFTLLVYVGFCLVALGQPDELILKTEGFELPVIGSKVSVEGFMLIAPVILIALTIYLHIFVGELQALKEGKPTQDLRPPYLFNLSGRTPRILTGFIFYWLPPLVLFSFAFGGAPFVRPALGDVLLFACATFTTIALALVALRRCKYGRRRTNGWFFWGVILSMTLMWMEPLLSTVQRPWDRPNILLITLSAPFGLIKPMTDHEPPFFVLRKRLLLEASDLSGIGLRRTDLQGALLTISDLEDSDLRFSNLSWAELFDANLSKVQANNAVLVGANLTFSDLSSSKLNGAILEGADLSYANLSEADLSGANLVGANAMSADFNGAILDGTHLSKTSLYESQTLLLLTDRTDAQGVTCEQLASTIGKPASIPSYLDESCLPQASSPSSISHGTFPITR
jgi:hypothetical protein